MKPTQGIDAFRNIQKYKASYISILVIVLLATNAFLCVLFAAEDMRREMSAYYNRLAFWDIDVTSTLLMDEADLQEILATDIVKMHNS